MRRCAPLYAILGGLTCLLLFPSHAAVSGTLREEAVSYRTKGYEKQQQGDYVGALTAYRKALALDPSYPTPHNDLGVVREMQGRKEEAAKAYQKALAINPNYLEAHANLAMLYERMDEPEKAIFHWLKRYQLGDPADPWTVRAEERLVSLGVLKTHPGSLTRRYADRKLFEDAFQRHRKTLDEFRILSDQRGDW